MARKRSKTTNKKGLVFNKEKLSKLIQQALEENELTHRELAELAHLPSNSTVATLLQGFYTDAPALKTLASLALHVFNIEMGELLAYLYDETDEIYIKPLSVSAIELGIQEIENVEDLNRVLSSVARQLDTLTKKS